MSAPDVAALLADADATVAQLANVCEQSYEPWITDSGTDLYPDEVSLHIEMLATALRAALADQRRLEWLDAQTMNVEYDGACPLPWSIFDVQIGRVKRSTLKGEGESLRAAIDAALTADGGVK